MGKKRSQVERQATVQNAAQVGAVIFIFCTAVAGVLFYNHLPIVGWAVFLAGVVGVVFVILNAVNPKS